MSSCFQILLVFLFGPEGELGSGVPCGSSEETVFRVFSPFLLFLQSSSVEKVLAEATSSSSMDSKKELPYKRQKITWPCTVKKK